jgi:hypothetical protein
MDNSTMLMNLKEYSEYLHGYNVIDCAVRSKNFLYILAREDYTKWPKSKWNSEIEPPPDEPHILKRLIPVMLAKPRAEVFSVGEYSGQGPSKIGTSKYPEEKCLIMTTLGQIYATGSGTSGFETRLESYYLESGISRGGVRKMRTIDGWLYACEGNRGVLKRLGKNQWKHWHDEIPDPPKADNSFDDIDGFSESDIYCVGLKGDVWHYDGKAWSQIEFPTNIDLETVCCAGDGSVYISGEGGTTFKGRGQKWKRIHKGEMSLPFKDMVWYEDRVWATSDYGVWHIHNDQQERADLPDGISAYAGNLSVADGVLMLAGYGGAGFLREGQWTKIFSAGSMAKAWRESQAGGQ